MARKSLFIQTAFLGDLLLSLPLIKRLKGLYPEDEWILLARKGCGALFEQMGLFSQVYEIDKSSPEKKKKSYENLKSLKKEVFHLVVVPHQSFTTAIFVASLKADKKIGYKKWWNDWAFHTRIERPMNLPEVLRQMALISQEDVEVQKGLEKWSHIDWTDLSTLDREKIPAWATMRFPFQSKLKISLTDLEKKLSLPIASQPRIFLAPGSQWGTKRWTVEGYQGIGQQFVKGGYQVIVIGSPDEQPIAQQVSDAIPGAKNIAGLCSLLELGALLETGKLLVTNDSGAMHMGTSAGIPIVAIFGPTVLRFGYRPWSDNSLVVENKDLQCRPCGKHGPQVCPLGTHECMKSIRYAVPFGVATALIRSSSD